MKCLQGGTASAVQPILWSGSKSEARMLDRLGLTEAARAAAAQTAMDRDVGLSRAQRMARRSTSDDAGAAPHACMPLSI